MKPLSGEPGPDIDPRLEEELTGLPPEIQNFVRTIDRGNRMDDALDKFIEISSLDHLGFSLPTWKAEIDTLKLAKPHMSPEQARAIDAIEEFSEAQGEKLGLKRKLQFMFVFGICSEDLPAEIRVLCQIGWEELSKEEDPAIVEATFAGMLAKTVAQEEEQ